MTDKFQFPPISFNFCFGVNAMFYTKQFEILAQNLPEFYRQDKKPDLISFADVKDYFSVVLHARERYDFFRNV